MQKKFKKTSSYSRLRLRKIVSAFDYNDRKNRHLHATNQSKNIFGWLGRNWANIANTFINAVLAIFTYLLFDETVRQRQISQEAVDESKRANDLTRESLKESRIKDSSDALKDSINMNLAYQSVNTQINAIEKNEKQFTIGNMPFLDIADIRFNQFEVGRQPFVYFDLINQGKMPAKITAAQIEMFPVPSRKTNIEQFLNRMKNIDINGYITTQYPKKIYVPVYDTITKELIDQYKLGRIHMLVVSEIRYLSESNKQPRLLRFAVYVRPESGMSQIVYLDNIDVL